MVALSSCSNPVQCDVGQIPVLTESGTTCKWECQHDPLYKKPANNKWPIIGGSLGAMMVVLAALVSLLLFVYCRKRRRERAAYLRDTADLASELSDTPLLKSTYLAPASVPKWRGAEDMSFVVLAPNPGDAGTELSMDIVDRPPENDPTLAVSDGAPPYRQEKTASAYPMLAQYSHPADLATSMSILANNGVLSYEAAKKSGNAALAAARNSVRGSPVSGTFDPFRTVPGSNI
ncbi:hypothetical protein GGH12_005195 [Coemansia sp. RSA 1822]|nr:hypothetical protein LPJ76_005078 [Coemansia sp. RSA 638]KAJ2119502.1 hypothetical protein IW147_005816 [Coemansia sp. RSA 720]KAJ2478880.1 hypothetical protein IWW56_003450 [Coemansia sp. RSA 2131]KAJ2539859.1 hypothetical protein GGF49_004913 [Coemansia sp. RSA 1853]KAJ2559903.1 hypothetical protein GGH12_005195 [Coemansia sp. RSA 1822]KAJ2656064.1 hypothetical protein IW148_005781 [Coemansia sp. RSA 1199]